MTDKKNYKLLIVDDEPAYRTLLSQILDGQGYTVIQAENGEQAVTMYKENNDIDLILLDVDMPLMNGYQVIDQIGKDCKSKGVGICLVTAKDTLDDVLHAISLGVSDYITKPSHRDTILEKVKRLLSSKDSADTTLNPSKQTDIPAELVGSSEDVDLRVTGISVTGLRLQTSTQLQQNSRIFLRSDKLQSIFGLSDDIQCSVLSSYNMNGKYVSNTSYVDIPEGFIERVRAFISSQGKK